MRPPCAYAEWVTCLDRLRNEDCDEEVLHQMQAGQLEWTSGVAERFVGQLSQTMDYRLKRAADLLARDLSRSKSEVSALTGAILGVRHRIEFVMRMANLSILPEQVREQLTELVTGYAESAQQALEDSARKDRSGRVLSLLRNNAITNLQSPPPPVSASVSSYDIGRPRRSIILS